MQEDRKLNGKVGKFLPVEGGSCCHCLWREAVGATDGMGISSVSGVGLTTIKHFWRLLAGLLAHFRYWEICWVVVAEYQLEASSQ